jgi:transmembrane sensor
MDADPRHRDALGFYGSAWSALAKPSQAGAGAELEQQLTRLAGRRRRWRIAAGGAAMAVLVGMNFLIWNSPPPARDSAPPGAVVLLAAGQTLPDGSVVQLKGNAQISTDYTESMRRVVLRQGEAHFAVRKDPARPFVVSAGGVEVRAVGTAFSVQLGSTAVEVMVTDGLVAVDKPAGPAHPDVPLAAAPLATVDAGRRVVVDIAPSVVVPEVSVVPPTELDERLAWRRTRLEFTRTPLAEAVVLLNQHAPASAARLAIADSAVASMRLSGVFCADNTDAFVLLLEGAFGVKAERSGNTIVLRKAR